MTLDEYTDMALDAGVRPDLDPEALARHFAKVAGLRAPLDNEALPTALLPFGCTTNYGAPLGRDKAGFWERQPDGSHIISLKRHRPGPRATFIEAHETGEIIGRIARGRLLAWGGPAPGTRDEERFANRFAAELVSPMADFFPRFRDSGLSIAAMVKYYNQSEHVVARQAKLVAQGICPMMIMICPVVQPRENGVLEAYTRDISTPLIELYDVQFSGTFRNLYTARGLNRLPRQGDYRSLSLDLRRTISERRPTWIQCIPQQDLFDPYDLSAFVEVRENCRKKAVELVFTFVRSVDGHHFARRASRENAIIIPQGTGVFGRFELTKKTYRQAARQMKDGKPVHETQIAVQRTLEEWPDEGTQNGPNNADGPLYRVIARSEVVNTDADAALRAALTSLAAA